MSIGISKTSEIAGFIGACLVDRDTGLMLASEGGGSLDLELASALCAQAIQAQLAMVNGLGLEDQIEDVLVTLGKQYHMVRALESRPDLFIYVVLDKSDANLGMARLMLKNVETSLTL